MEPTLRDGSTYFSSLLSGSWKAAEKEIDGCLFIDRDGEMFAYVLAFLRSGKLPLFYDDDEGFDHDKYTTLLLEAEYFGVDALSAWIRDKKYERVIELRRSAHLHYDLDELKGSIPAGWKYQYFPDWETRKVYVCPRGLAKHKGEPSACGRQCHNARGGEEPQYEDEREVVVVEISSHKTFNMGLLTA